MNDTELLGQLIAEIAKFGGASKEDASRLARILLPHIDQSSKSAQQQLLDELIERQELVLEHGADYHDKKQYWAVPVRVLEKKRATLQGGDR